jgi:hypothetical protein
MALLRDWSMIEDEPTSSALDDDPPGGAPWSRRRVAIVLVLALAFIGLAWWGERQIRQQACEKRSRFHHEVASYDDRLQLRETAAAPEGVPPDQSKWAEIRTRLDNHEREWIPLRTRACVERDTALERCLDAQAGKTALRIDAWIDGDPSWATVDLDDALPAPTRCLEQLGR